TEAVGNQHLHGAAALELQPIPALDAADYLVRCRVQPSPPEWQRLIDHVRDQPAGALAAALDSPLPLSLIRDTVHTPQDIDALLDPTRFTTSTDVEDYLLTQVLPVAYQDRPGHPTGRYSLQQAQQWLGYLATQMNRQRTRDLVWWRIHQWASPWP